MPRSAGRSGSSHAMTVVTTTSPQPGRDLVAGEPAEAFAAALPVPTPRRDRYVTEAALPATGTWNPDAGCARADTGLIAPKARRPPSSVEADDRTGEAPFGTAGFDRDTRHFRREVKDTDGRPVARSAPQGAHGPSMFFIASVIANCSSGP